MSEHDQWYSANVLQGRTPVRAGLELLAKLRQQHEFDVCVVILPEFSAPFSQYRSAAIHQQVFASARDLSEIPVVDLLENFATIGGTAQSFAWDGLHLNELGHDVTARILLPVIRNRIAPPSAMERPESI